MGFPGPKGAAVSILRRASLSRGQTHWEGRAWSLGPALPLPQATHCPSLGLSLPIGKMRDLLQHRCHCPVPGDKWCWWPPAPPRHVEIGWALNITVTPTSWGFSEVQKERSEEMEAPCSSGSHRGEGRDEPEGAGGLGERLRDQRGCQQRYFPRARAGR